MDFSTIKQGDVFYGVIGDNITRYEYLCIFPSRNPKYTTPSNYHIVINKNREEPERIYYSKLQAILDMELFTYEDAKAKVKQYLIDRLKGFDKDY